MGEWKLKRAKREEMLMSRACRNLICDVVFRRQFLAPSRG